MVNMTLSVSDELHKKMSLFKEIRWSEVARQAFEKRVADLEFVDKIAEKSKLNKKDVLDFSKKIKALASKRFMDEDRNRL